MEKTEAASDWDDGPEVQKSGGNLRMKDIHDFSMDVRSSVCLKARKPTTVGLSDF